jgi:hypothetical protein
LHRILPVRFPAGSTSGKPCLPSSAQSGGT